MVNSHFIMNSCKKKWLLQGSYQHKRKMEATEIDGRQSQSLFQLQRQWQLYVLAVQANVNWRMIAVLMMIGYVGSMTSKKFWKRYVTRGWLLFWAMLFCWHILILTIKIMVPLHMMEALSPKNLKIYVGEGVDKVLRCKLCWHIAADEKTEYRVIEWDQSIQVTHILNIWYF